MRIAIDARLAAYSAGGTVQYTIWLARALARVAPEEEILLLQHARSRRPLVSAPNVRTVALRTPPHHRLEQLVLPLELLPLRPTVLHSTDFIPPFRRPCPAVVTVHDLGFLRFPDTVTAAARRYYSQVERAVRSAEAVVVPSRATAGDLETLLGAPAAKIAVIPHGVAELFRPPDPSAVAATRARFRLDGPYLLYVGTIEPRKNLGVLLQAFASVGATRPPLTLVLAGQRGWLDQPVFDLIERLGLQERVRLTGPLGAAELPPLYGSAAAFVLPSLYEGFGMPVLEAMACGTPVVCSAAGSLPEVAGDAALLVPPGDERALAEAIARVLEDRELQDRLRARGRARAAQFTWERSARRHLAVYRRAAGAPAAASRWTSEEPA